MKSFPSLFGPYQVLAFLGSGATSKVYRANRPPDATEIALKILSPAVTTADEWLRRFQREASVMRRLQHRNIVHFLDFGECEGVWYLAMELVSGSSLRSLVGQRLHQPALAKLGAQLASGLEAAHQLGLVHRDLKPENVLLTRDGIAKILDWGLARMFTRIPERSLDSVNDVTSVGMVVGPPRYMSPEQTLGQTLTPASDIFSLGLCLFELASRRHPFLATSTVEVMAEIRDQAAPGLERWRPDLPPAFHQLIVRMLQKHPEGRPSATEVYTTLRGLSA
jgi:eukaryotic-like serine/threonine-protein kinase